MEDILGAKGNLNHGVLQISVDRTDLQTIITHGIATVPSFDGHHELTFQSLDWRFAMTNSVVALVNGEIQRAIDAIRHQRLVMQGFHQHFYDQNPQLWHIHFRGKGSPLDLATRVRAVMDAVPTPLPQPAPPPPSSTPFDPNRIAKILGGNSTAVAPDFSMEARSVMQVMDVMRSQGWDVNCLYNQETDEFPQLFYSHHLKTGDPYVLAAEVRNGLNQTEVRR